MTPVCFPENPNLQPFRRFSNSTISHCYHSILFLWMLAHDLLITIEKQTGMKGIMAKIFLHGDCLVGRASELHQLFLYHFKETREALEIDMSSTVRCDVSFFQLMCAACRGFAGKNKRLTILPPPEEVIAQFEKAGWRTVCAGCHKSVCALKGVMLKEETP
jgi:hypothetical protein